MSPEVANHTNYLKDSVQLNRIILDLKIMGLSLADIQRHLFNCFHYSISIRQVKQILLDLGQEAQKMNQYYDTKVLSKIQIAEADEIYQGREGAYLGIVDKATNYLVCLKQLSEKNQYHFMEIFNNFKDKLTNLRCWITDGFPTYNPVFDELYPEIIHIICHVHTYRDVMRELDIYNRRANRSYMKLKNIQNALNTIHVHLKSNRNSLISHQNVLQQLESSRDDFYKHNNLEKYSKTKRFKEIRADYRKKINFARTLITSYSKQVKIWEKKLILREKERKAQKVEYSKFKTIALQSGRLVAQFKILLDSKPNNYESEYIKYKIKLEKSPYPIAHSLLKMLKNKPKIFNDKRANSLVNLPPNYANTNTIESIFGRYRLFFKKYRTMYNTTYNCAIFEILRLHHNLTPPLHGPNSERSPIQRALIHTKYKNGLECLCGL